MCSPNWISRVAIRAKTLCREQISIACNIALSSILYEIRFKPAKYSIWPTNVSLFDHFKMKFWWLGNFGGVCLCVCVMVRDVQFSKQIKSNFRRSGPRFVFVPFDSNGTIYDICLHAFAYSCPFSFVILSQLSVFIYSAAIYRRVRRTVIYWLLQRICYKQISAECPL